MDCPKCKSTNSKKKGIILWTIGERSHHTFAVLWSIIRCWRSFWYVTRTHPRSVPREARSGALAPRWKVYPMYLEPEEHLGSKTYMIGVKGENTRLRHYLGGAYAPDRRNDGTGRGSVRIASPNALLFQIFSFS